MWNYLSKIGRVTVEAARSPAAVAEYTSKYCVKAGFHYEMCGFPEAWNLDK